MAAKARIIAGLFIVCTILPSLVSAFADHLPEVNLDNGSDKNDGTTIHNVAHIGSFSSLGRNFKKEIERRVKKENDKWKKNVNGDQGDDNPTPAVEEDKNATPDPEPANPEPANPEPTPNPEPANPNAPANPNLPAGVPGAPPTPVTMGYGSTPVTTTPGSQTPQPVQPNPNEKHPTPEEIKKLRKKAGLEVGYYNDVCPDAEKIIREGLTRAFGNDSSIAAAMPRLLFHDCFVKGCDASLLLDNSPSGAKVEKVSTNNGPTVRGFEVIDEIKAELEKQCPEVVSCADLLAYAARDAFSLSGVPHYEVPGGRHDGMDSLEADVAGNLPVPDMGMDAMIALFKRKGMSEEDLVVLIGAHSIGVAHCYSFLYRLDNPDKAALVDPRLFGVMRFTCTNQMNTLPFDTTTQYKMDSIYYKQLGMKKALLESDALLAQDPRTKNYVQKFGDDEKGWFEKLGKAMNKLASIQVLTEETGKGQIRKQCRAVNN